MTREKSTTARGKCDGTKCQKLFQPMMAKTINTWLIAEFSIIDPNQSIIEWSGKAELVCHAVDRRSIRHLPATD